MNYTKILLPRIYIKTLCSYEDTSIPHFEPNSRKAFDIIRNILSYLHIINFHTKFTLLVGIPQNDS